MTFEGFIANFLELQNMSFRTYANGGLFPLVFFQLEAWRSHNFLNYGSIDILVLMFFDLLTT